MIPGTLRWLHAATAMSAGGNVRVAGSAFSVTGAIPCATSASQPMHGCRFGVVRQANGAATVTMFLPGGGERTTRFASGTATVADRGAVFMKKAGDLNKVTVGTDERFEIPDAVIVGG